MRTRCVSARRLRASSRKRWRPQADADLQRVLYLQPGNSDAQRMAATDLRELRAADTVSQTALARKMFAANLR
jgi:hypothetical protein